ncbi:MAG: hypothetical protein DI547_09520 [Sphingobium sp.]|jgi:hypothetical protein|nr:MAG: hypothetical protein DI547_09520 [Sphingobium sp.]
MMRTDAAFAFKTAIVIIVAHAIAYLAHEYSHSFAAWVSGYMENPLALDYGGINPGNLVFLSDVGDNVQYDPIMDSGHGLTAAAIALAGPFVGNALLYAGLYATTGFSRPRDSLASSLLFWMLAMCAGNVWSYVPMRALTTHADIAIAAQGLRISVLALFPFLLVPSLFIAYHFFAKVCPLFIPAITAGRAARTALLVSMTAIWFFMLFGGVGLSGSYGPISQTLSVVSEALCLPLAITWLWKKCARAHA